MTPEQFEQVVLNRCDTFEKLTRLYIRVMAKQIDKEISNYNHEADHLDTKDPYCQCKNSGYGYAMPVCFTCKKQKNL